MHTNERGNEIYRDFEADKKLGIAKGEDRYFYDFEALPPSKWKQYDTSQDAWYFGVWVNIEERLTFTYAEGDRSLVICPTVESLKAELENMGTFYGAPPPAFITVDRDGTVTHFMDERPSVPRVVKTRQGWSDSKLDLGKYLQVGDEVDEELAQWWLEVLPPATWTSEIRQIGEPNSHIRGRETFATLYRAPGSKAWLFAGHCFQNEFTAAR